MASHAYVLPTFHGLGTRLAAAPVLRKEVCWLAILNWSNNRVDLTHPGLS